MSALNEICRGFARPAVVVRGDGHDFAVRLLQKLGIIAVEEDERRCFACELLIIMQVWIWERGLGSFHDDAVHDIAGQKLEDIAFFGDAVVGCHQLNEVAVIRCDFFDAAQNMRKDIGADIGRDDRNTHRLFK